jgi:ABC-type sugar transport system permease subunit
MKHRTFFWFILPSALAMVLFIALPLVSVVVQSLFIEHEQVLIQSEVCDPFRGCRTTTTVDAAATALLREAAPLGRFNGLGTYLRPQPPRHRRGGRGLAPRRGASRFPRRLMNLPFYKALAFTLAYTFVVTPLTMMLGLVIALAVNGLPKLFKGPTIFVSLLPMIVTPLVGSLILFWMIDARGVLGDAPADHGRSDAVAEGVDPADVGHALRLRRLASAPFAFIVFYAGLQTVPSDTLEAAMIDGASRWERIRYVVLPHLLPLSCSWRSSSSWTTSGSSSRSSASRPRRMPPRSATSSTPTSAARTQRFGSAAATSVLTMIGVAILLSPVLVRTWRDFNRKRARWPPGIAAAAPVRVKAVASAFVAPLADPCRLPLPLDALGVVQGRGRLLLEGGLEERADRPADHRRDRRAFTGAGYYGAWVQEEFWRAAMNTLIVVVCVVCISLTFGTLGGYALARSGFRYAFWLLMLALVFRAMPPITLVSGYLLPFFEWNLWGHLPTAIIVLVAINQPFTLWMLHSLLPQHPQGPRRKRHGGRLHAVPGVPARHRAGDVAGGHHDGAVQLPARLQRLRGDGDVAQPENQTMVPKIASFLGSTQVEGNVMFAVAAVVSITAPLFLLVVFFQRQIVRADRRRGEGVSMDFQAEKAVVRAHHAALAGAGPEGVAEALARHTAPGLALAGDASLRHPRGRRGGGGGLLGAVPRRLQPGAAAGGHLLRRAERDGRVQGALGRLHGASHGAVRQRRGSASGRRGRMAFLRYAEFHRVEDGRIAETAMFFDIPHLMIQAGQNPFPPATAAHLVQPGPIGHDGLLHGPQDPAEGERTLAAINAMISDLGTWQLGLPLEEELARTWHDDMIWWGPAGIGATYTIERYAKQHSGPFRAAFRDRTGTGHLARSGGGAVRRVLRLAQLHRDPAGRVHGDASLRHAGRVPRGGHLPARGWHAGRELGVHRHPALPEDAGAGCAGARSNGVQD